MLGAPEALSGATTGPHRAARVTKRPSQTEKNTELAVNRLLRGCRDSADVPFDAGRVNRGDLVQSQD